ncbi:MAG: prolyl oligopeptidase family serine peptidase [Bacteroidia bacterium]|nr:prolyl oligopeptidase family serine peptidase [Bacteroidia bacterium]
MKGILIVGILLAQELTLSDIWQEYRYYASQHELIAGTEGWYAQGEDGKVYRWTRIGAAETLGQAQNMVRWMPAPGGWLAWDKLKRSYRHSSFGSIVWMQNGQLRRLPGERWYEAAFSPDGRTLLATDGQNLYAWRGEKWDTLTHCTDARQAGHTDWLYEEEFGFTRAFEIAPSGRYVAYLLLDNQRTPVYPLLTPGAGSYPNVYSLRYPRVGAPNPRAELHLYDLSTGADKVLWVDSVGGYLPWFSWSTMGDDLYFTHLNRAQNRFTLYRYEVGEGQPTAFFSDSTKGFFTWDNRRLIVWATDQPELFYLAGGKGPWEIWRYDYKGRRLATYTVPGLRELVGYARGRLFFCAQGKTPKDQRVGFLTMKQREPTWLTPETGWAEAELSGNLLWIKESRFLEPYRERLCAAEDPTRGLTLPELNYALRARMPKVQVRFVEFPASGAKSRWGYLLLPERFDSARVYPVVLTFYGGPGSQQVSEEFKNIHFFWQAYLVQKGYIVACADGRGTALYPEERFSIYRRLGLPETEDLVAFVKYLKGLPYVGKIGAFGWSYGGYMAARLAFAAPDGLAAAVAVAPVTDWRLYDSAYTERFMGLLEQNAEGYEQTALPPKGSPLRVPLLLIHGETDDNVHPQHTYQLVEKLLRQQPEAPLEWRIFPGQNHGIGAYRYRVYWELERFFERYLR